MYSNHPSRINYVYIHDTHTQHIIYMLYYVGSRNSLVTYIC